MKAKSFSAIITLLLVAFLATGAFAQSLISGDIVGTVTDSAGAVVPNATVALKSEATGQTRTETTNASGHYRFPLLQPGPYVISVTAQGFATMKKSVTVQVGQTPELNFALNVKGSTEVVEVSGEAPLLQTESANTGTAFNQAQVSLLPNGGGDITQIAEFAPGAVMSTGAGYGNFTVNGTPANSNVFTVNGTNNMDPYFNVNNSGATNLTLGGSEIAEAAVVGNAYSAEYGQQVGAQVTYVTKGGSNQLHGEANWKWTGASMSARDFFNDKGSQQPFSNNNQYAANIGGPIVKDKSFFFASTEGLRYYLPTSTAAYGPNAAYENATLTNIATFAPSELSVYQQTFGIWDTAAGRSSAVPYDAYTDTWRATPSTFSKEWLMSVRFDQNFTQNDRAFFRFHTDHGLQATFTDPLNPALFSNSSNQPAYGGQAQWTHIFKSGATNQFIFSSDYYRAGFDQNLLGAQKYPYYVTFGDMAFTDVGGENFNFPQGRDVHQHQFIDDYSVRKGNHTFKFGVNARIYNIDDYIFERNQNVIRAFAWGDPSYAGVPANLTNTGAENDGFQYGVSYQARLRFPNQNSENINMWGLGIYAEDELKVSSKVTLTYGLRMEHNANPTCQAKCFSQFNTTWSGVDHDPNTPYNASIQTGLKNAFPEVDKMVFGPRVGLAWSPTKNTVVRAGYGLFYDAVPAALVDAVATNFPGFNYLYNRVDSAWVQGGSSTFGNGTNAWSNLQVTNQYLKSGYAQGKTASDIQAQVAGAGAFFSPPTFTSMPAHFDTPMYQKYSLEVQRMVGSNDSVTLGYTGNHGRKLTMSDGMVNAYKAAGVAPFPTSAPDSRFANVTDYNSEGYSWYNGMTVTWNHRMKAGLSAQVNYTWSHATDTVSNLGSNGTIYGGNSINGYMIPGNADFMYASSDFDVRHLISANFVWQPRFDTWMHAPKVIGKDWTFTGTMLNKTGGPFTVTSFGRSVTNGWIGGGQAYFYPTVTGNQWTCDSSATHTACLGNDTFANPTTTVSDQRRNMFRGPGYFDMDLSISKGFQIVPSRENMKLVLGMNAYNVLNHPNFANPCTDALTGTCGTFGMITSTVSPATSPYGSFTGSAASARILQFNAKFQF